MVRQLLEAGWKMNDILDSPLFYLIEVLSNNKKQIHKTESLISAFGG